MNAQPHRLSSLFTRAARITGLTCAGLIVLAMSTTNSFADNSQLAQWNRQHRTLIPGNWEEIHQNQKAVLAFSHTIPDGPGRDVVQKGFVTLNMYELNTQNGSWDLKESVSGIYSVSAETVSAGVVELMSERNPTMVLRYEFRDTGRAITIRRIGSDETPHTLRRN